MSNLLAINKTSEKIKVDLTMLSSQSEGSLETVAFFQAELLEARDQLTSWSIGDDNQHIQQMLWCLRGSCSSFGITDLNNKVDTAHNALNSTIFAKGVMSMNHVFQELIWSLDSTIQEIDRLVCQQVQ